MLPTTFFILSIILLVVEASILHGLSSLSVRHHSLVSRKPSTLEVYVRAEKRCPNRKHKPAKSPAALAANIPSTSSSQPQATPPAQSNNGLIQVNGGDCAPNRATIQVTSVSGPNGHIDWMNCGFEGAGWRPPYVQVKDLITVPLGVALQNPDSPFKACAAYINLFEKWGGIHGIPSIMLASFAMQESSCRPDMVGGGGEQGLMQITIDKCGGAPGGNCQDPDYNIGTGAAYFSQTLASNDGNFFLALGRYNGWYANLTQSAAFAAAYSRCCLCQNNGDYLVQFANGWLLGIDPSNRRIGKYFNLAVCPGHS